MALELVYTSAERGLKPRSHGFCTVAMTRGMAAGLVERLESLSAYRSHFAPHDPEAAENPVNYSYYRFSIGGRTVPVLSRVAFAGFDHTGRSNKIAHHVALEPHELALEGPAWVARQDGFFIARWAGEPRLIGGQKQVKPPGREAASAATWREVVGDAGWAGAVAEHTLTRPGAPVVMVYRPEVGSETLLAMMDEALALVPPEKRWDVTYSTYLTDMPAGTTCHWRCVLPRSAELQKVQRNRAALVIDLTRGAVGRANGGALVEAARVARDPYADQLAARRVAMVAVPRGAAKEPLTMLPADAQTAAQEPPGVSDEQEIQQEWEAPEPAHAVARPTRPARGHDRALMAASVAVLVLACVAAVSVVVWIRRGDGRAAPPATQPERMPGQTAPV